MQLLKNLIGQRVSVSLYHPKAHFDMRVWGKLTFDGVLFCLDEASGSAHFFPDEVKEVNRHEIILNFKP